MIPLMMFGWIPFTIILFKRNNIEKAIMISLLGGIMFLPMSSYDIPLVNINKNSIIALSLLIADSLVGNSQKKASFTKMDLPILVFCIFSPFVSSVINGLGVYDGINVVINALIGYGTFYYLGKKYFSSLLSLEYVAYSILTGVLLYIPLCIIELNNGPTLNIWLYGFIQHSLLQHIRMGGYRPLVFMEHGLMVSFWLYSGAIIAIGFLKSKSPYMKSKSKFRIYSAVIVIMTILSKSLGVIIYLLVSVPVLLLVKNHRKIISLLMISISIYLAVRLLRILPTEVFMSYLNRFINPDRIQSLWFRMYQEDIILDRSVNNFLFGWGRVGRALSGVSVNSRSLSIIDSLWLILYSQFGLVGVISYYSSLLILPGLIYKKKGFKHNTVFFSLSLLLIFYSIDNLINAMLNPVFYLISGAIISIHHKREIGSSY